MQHQQLVGGESRSTSKYLQIFITLESKIFQLILQKLQKENERLRIAIRECEEKAARIESKSKHETSLYDKYLEEAAAHVSLISPHLSKTPKFAARQIPSKPKIPQSRKCQNARSVDEVSMEEHVADETTAITECGESTTE
jgi:hypothetical protein